VSGARGARAGCAAAAAILLASCHRGGDPTQRARDEMVDRQVASRGIHDAHLLAVMRRVPRHLFVPHSEAEHAYEDKTIQIGSGQTITQPYVAAFMTEQLHLTGSEKVLEIGTGSGYEAALLAALARSVYSVEIRPELAATAVERLRALGIANVAVRAADGYKGWPEAAPFDGIIVTAAPEKVPPPLLEQLATGGRMVIPVGGFYQELKVIEKTEGGYLERSVLPVRFVPFARAREDDGRR
jgi:protein-L-isoaspartate(D-aspartate) O-methyltransferase